MESEDSVGADPGEHRSPSLPGAAREWRGSPAGEQLSVAPFGVAHRETGCWVRGFRPGGKCTSRRFHGDLDEEFAYDGVR